MMASALVSRHTTTTPLGVGPDVALRATCPLCHTRHPTLTNAALDAGGEWWCVTCGQRWDAGRLATVTGYAAWVLERARLHRRGRRDRQAGRYALPR